MKLLLQAVTIAAVLLSNSLIAGVQSAPQKGSRKLAPPLVSAPIQAKTYTIVPAESSLTVFVGKAGALSFLAHDHNIAVRSYSGRVVIPAAGAAAGSLELDIDAKSLAVLDKISEKDRQAITNSMNNIVLESGKFPKIPFRSVSITNFNGPNLTINGDLTLHGVTRRIAIPASISATPQSLRARGRYVLKQTDFGITPYSAAAGSIKVKNEVIINFNIVAK